jgi:hypothetical protein
MAKVDVADILDDPDFTDEITQIVRTPILDLSGKQTFEEYRVDTIGVVQPISGETLQRLPDALRNADIRSFWLKGEIHATNKDKYPDILIFQGYRYLVQTAMPWTNWGKGWTEGVCINEGST